MKIVSTFFLYCQNPGLWYNGPIRKQYWGGRWTWFIFYLILDLPAGILFSYIAKMLKSGIIESSQQQKGNKKWNAHAVENGVGMVFNLVQSQKFQKLFQ
jgi:hypothetical protein